MLMGRDTGILKVRESSIAVIKADMVQTNRKSAGFTDEERNKMTELLKMGFTDTFRYLYPEKENAYSWWSYMSNAREKNVGWRIDYFIVSKSIEIQIQDSMIYSEVLGSDHCPIGLEIKI